MAREIELMPPRLNFKKVTVFFFLVAWTVAITVLIRFANSTTRLYLPQWHKLSLATGQKPIKYSENTEDIRQLHNLSGNSIASSTFSSTRQLDGGPKPAMYNGGTEGDLLQPNSSRDSVVPARHPTTKRPLSSKTSEQFTPFRYHFNQTFSMNIDVGRDNVTDNTSYLLYRCDDKLFRNCGGWADRLKGIMAGYVIANLTGRVFKAEMLSPPCDLQKYLVPNLVNWSLPVPFHRTLQKEMDDVQRMIYIDSRAFWRNVKNIDFTSHPAMKARYVYYKSNLDYMDGFRDSKFFHAQVSWMKNLTRDQINAIIFKRLFKMSPRLESLVSSFLSKNLKAHDKLVCIHIRTGRNPSIPHDSVERVRERDLPEIWNFLRGISNGPRDKIFIMSDSENVIADAKRQSFGDKLFSSGGEIVHAERSRYLTTEEKCAGMENVFLEQFVLMHCDSLVISKSGLSRMSAYVRGRDEDLYCLLEQGRVVPCKARDFQELYKILG